LHIAAHQHVGGECGEQQQRKRWPSHRRQARDERGDQRHVGEGGESSDHGSKVMNQRREGRVNAKITKRLRR
jgi:hypothetical protein